MMKQLIFTGALVLAGAMTGEAMAACATGGTLQQDLTTLLTNKTVCDASATYNTSKPEHPSSGIKVMGIQEEHHSDGQLWDYKLGPGDPTDPRIQVGNWSVTGINNDPTTTVTYTYPGGGGGTYQVYLNGMGKYEFCNGPAPAALVATTTIVPTTGSGRDCP